MSLAFGILFVLSALIGAWVGSTGKRLDPRTRMVATILWFANMTGIGFGFGLLFGLFTAQTETEVVLKALLGLVTALTPFGLTFAMARLR